jgi:Tol biopolymer transport system component
MMMRAETINGIKPVSQVNLPIVTWPGGTTRYLYGVYFMRFVSEVYGEEKIQEFIEAYSGNLLPFSINTTSKRVFGKDITDMWSEFDAWLKTRYSAQIKKINDEGLKAGAPLTNTGYVNQPVRLSGSNVYYIRNAGNHQAELVRFSGEGESPDVQVLTEVHQRSDFRVHDEAGVLLSQIEICDEYSLYRDLYIYDEAEEELKRITECGRYTAANWMPDGKNIIALHHKAGALELHRLSLNGDIEDVLWKSTQDEVISQFDISPDGKGLVADVWRKSFGWNLELFNFENKQWEAITTNTDIQANPSYSDNGDSIIYSADYDGVYNLYRYNINARQHTKISNVIGGALQGQQLSSSDPLYYVGYTAEGTNIYRLDNAESKGIIEPQVGSKLKTYDYQVEQFSENEYSAWPSLRPRWWFPALSLDDDSTEIGFTTAGNDALGIHNYFLTLAFETENSIPLGSLVYAYSNRFLFAVERSNNIFQDNNGDFERARPTDLVQAVFILPRTSLLSQHNFLLAASWEKDSDDTLASGALPADDFEDNLLGLAWLYNNARRYPLSISVNDGLNLRLVAEDSDTFSSDYTGQVYTLDWKQFIRTGNESVFAFRLLQGWGTESPNLFRLGGEDTGVSLSLTGLTGTAVFAEREYALRGYDEGKPQLRGRRAQIVSAEWRFPIERVERGIMAPPLGLMQWSGAVFVDSGAAYNDDSPDEYFTGAGVEINADLNVFYMVPIRARLGYAHGFDENIGDDRVYLQVGASF